MFVFIPQIAGRSQCYFINKTIILKKHPNTKTLVMKQHNYYFID